MFGNASTKKRGFTLKKYKLFWFVLMVVMLVHLASAVNFGGPSPDTGEADGGWHTGTFAATSGTYADTRASDSVYFSVERGNSAAANANQTLAFNVSALSSNPNIMITNINGTLRYCHARQATNGCSGAPGQTPQGAAGIMRIYIINVSSNRAVQVGTIPTASNTLTGANWAVNSGANFPQFINSSGFINLIFEFIWSGTGRSAFLNEHSNLTVFYSAGPTVTLSGPPNATAYIGASNLLFACNTTDDSGLKNVTLYHNINGAFAANQTVNITGLSNSTQFNITGVTPGSYIWNCLASDGIFSPVFASANFTFSVIADSYPNATLISPPDSNSSTNQNLTFISDLADDINLKNATLYINSTGIFEANQSVQITGLTNTTSFAINNLAVNTTYLWNVFVCDSSNQCSFAQANYSFAILQEQQNQSQPGQPPTPGQSSPSSSPPINNPYSDSGFDKAALARIAAQERSQSPSPSPVPSESAPSAPAPQIESSAPPERTSGLLPITGSTVLEGGISKYSYGLLLFILALLFIYIFINKFKQKKPKQPSFKESAFKSDWKVDHDNYGKKHDIVQNAPAQKPKRLTFYDIYEHFPETYKEIRSKGMITLPNKKIEVSKDRTLSPKDLKAMFPSSLGKVKEGSIKAYTPVNRAQEVHPVLKDMGVQESVYQIVKPKRGFIAKPELLPTRKINKLDKPKNRIIEGLKGVYKTG